MKESNNRSYDGLVRLERELDTADAILIGAGAGLSHISWFYLFREKV